MSRSLTDGETAPRARHTRRARGAGAKKSKPRAEAPAEARRRLRSDAERHQDGRTASGGDLRCERRRASLRRIEILFDVELTLKYGSANAVHSAQEQPFAPPRGVERTRGMWSTGA